MRFFCFNDFWGLFFNDFVLILRFQAIECYLANVKPTNRIADNPEIWDDHSVGRFEELTHGEFDFIFFSKN